MNYSYWFANIAGIGNRTKNKLILAAGSAEELYFLPESQLKRISDVEEEAVDRLMQARKSETQPVYETLCEEGIAFLTLEDEAYPEKLRQIPDAPYALYVKGRLPDENHKSVAIVGARMCSEYGRAVARQLARRLASHGICVVSGMARGIDAAGHTGALEADGITCAVLGCGVDICYPKSNAQLYQNILQKGCILSEYPPGTPPQPMLFPQRNRIISGLSDVVVVVEARERSGSLITADQALEQGRDVYAVPGRMYDSLSSGCNGLIRQGAGIISNIEDFVKELEVSGINEYRQENFENLLLEKEESLVYSCVDLRPRNIEELLQKTKLPMPVLAQILAQLQHKGFIAETFKNYYIRQS